LLSLWGALRAEEFFGSRTQLDDRFLASLGMTKQILFPQIIRWLMPLPESGAP
jgi:hypothetical protein